MVPLTDDIRSAFTVYLAGHPRPMAELLNPNEQPLATIYAAQFAGMAREPVSVETLVETRRRLVKELNDRLRTMRLEHLMRAYHLLTCRRWESISRLIDRSLLHTRNSR